MVSELSVEEVRTYIITKRGNATKNDVAKHMIELENKSIRLSRVTTLKLIDNLKSKGIIIVRYPARKGMSHFLVINDGNSFNLIDKWIGKAEIIGEIVQRNLDRISDLYYKPSNSENKELDELWKYFQTTKEFVVMMIHILLAEIYNKITSDNDKLTLTLKAVNVLVKTLKSTDLPRPPINLGQFFDYSASYSESARQYGNNAGIQIENMNYIVKTFEEFDKHILP